MGNPFSWDDLTSRPLSSEVLSPSAVAFLVVFGVGFLVSIVLYNDGAKRFLRNGVQRRVVRRGGAIAMVVYGIGLFFFGIRLLEINPFTLGTNLWLWLSVLAMLLMFLYFALYLRTGYRAALASYEERRRKQQYLRPAAAAPTGAVRTAKPNPKRSAKSGKPSKAP